MSQVDYHIGGYLSTDADRHESRTVPRPRGLIARKRIWPVIELLGPSPDLRRCSLAQDTGQDTMQAPIEVGKVEMAQKVTVALEDDLTGGPAEQTVRFAFEGTGYEIDLNAKNAAAFGKQLAPYLEYARKVGRAQPRRPGAAQPAALG